MARRGPPSTVYQVLPERTRLAVQTTVEGVGVPVAIGISGVLILALVALPVALTATIVVTLLVCVAWTWVGLLLPGLRAGSSSTRSSVCSSSRSQT